MKKVLISTVSLLYMVWGWKMWAVEGGEAIVIVMTFSAVASLLFTYWILKRGNR